MSDDTDFEVWWCRTHKIGQIYENGLWWDESVPYQCATKSEFPTGRYVEGECVPLKVRVVKEADDE